MCTLSLTPVPGGLRLVFNRDELVTPPPMIHTYGPRTATHPTDPQAGGTWLAANDAGLTCAILNRTPRDHRPPPCRLSRGSIIPALLHHRNARAAAHQARSLLLSEFP